jgi:predicted lipid-binding transport protein (Tim44 family)
MKTLSFFAAALVLGFTLSSGDADAASKRLGGGKSAGMQRQAVTPAPAAAPAQAAAPTAAKAQPAAGAPQAQPQRSWMGPLAGLAAGLGLAALASHFGFGEQLASMLMIGLLVMAVMVVIGLIMRRRAGAQMPGTAAKDGLQYAATGADSAATKRGGYELSLPASASGAVAAAAANIPADFDAAGFARNAKVNFIRLQAANDAGNLDDIREFTTPEMFAEIRTHIAERGNAGQETDVVSLEADVVDVAEEGARYVVSVRFRGLIREDKGAEAQSIDEIWNMVKPRDGSGGWVVAGIQQTL